MARPCGGAPTSPKSTFNPNETNYHFDVSNGGEYSDADHDEIYSKDGFEGVERNVFRRDLSYVGTHLLRCVVTQRGVPGKAQRVFVVRGCS